ncbi:hypothetical protein NDU88_004985 [Pleurodeles waltl]|uniref:Uncharacterized protein n=1 Tax=Pleurodeles waltl TaxID=8319 RepID=A0AAV7UKT0_PLEWA|nr:hypothetical protein NDU88_004985 [Pleurodeles waltl]
MDVMTRLRGALSGRDGAFDGEAPHLEAIATHGPRSQQGGPLPPVSASCPQVAEGTLRNLASWLSGGNLWEQVLVHETHQNPSGEFDVFVSSVKCPAIRCQTELL